MTLLVVDGPGLEGQVTDTPETQLRRRQAVLLQDATLRDYVLRQRRGFAYLGDTVIASGTQLESIGRMKFQLADVTRNIVCSDGGDIYHVPDTGAAVGVFSGPNAVYLHRTTYDDQAILCAQDGKTPLRMYAGADAESYTAPSSANQVDGEREISAVSGAWESGITKGAYVFHNDGYAPNMAMRMLEQNGTTDITIEGLRASGSTIASSSINVRGTGFTFPAIPVYEIGSVSISASTTANGAGTKWDDFGVDPTSYQDTILMWLETGALSMATITIVTNNTQMGISTSSPKPTGEVRYAIMRRCPFTEAETHRSSLWGWGVDGQDSKLWVFPQGANLGLPPGVTDSEMEAGFTDGVLDERDLMADFYNVPSRQDSDRGVALLSTPGPLLAIKEHSTYAISGVYGNARVDLFRAGVGCIDVRTAFSAPEGQFWADREGVYWYRYGQMVNLTMGRPDEGGGVHSEWLAWLGDWDSSSYMTCGVSDGVLLASGDVSGDQRTYAFDLSRRVCIGRWEGVNPRYMKNVAIEGEQERLLAVTADENRMHDYRPAINGTGDAHDADGNIPQLKYHGPRGLSQIVNIPSQSRLTRVGIQVRFVDTAGEASAIRVSTVHSGRRDEPDDFTLELDEIDSNAADNERHILRRPGFQARHHQLRLEKMVTASTESECSIPQVSFDIRSMGAAV